MRAGIFLLLLLSTVVARTLPTLKQLEAETDSFLYLDRRKIGLDRVDTTVPFYCAYTYMTIDAPYLETGRILLGFEKYDSVFSVLTDMHLVEDKRLPNPSYYMEGKASFFHCWGAGAIAGLVDSGPKLEIRIRPVPIWLFRKFRAANRGRVRWFVKDVYIDGFLIPHGKEQCRIGIRGYSATSKPLPTPLIELLLFFIMPSLVRDVEDAAQALAKGDLHGN